MLSRLSFILLIGFAAAGARAQVIYEPLQYQYGDQDKFYYGGSDPHVFDRAAAPADAGAQWGRSNGSDFSSGDVWVHREVSDQPVRIYSDALPTQIATLYGFTATDAVNVANASQPRYFRKADIIAAARASHGMLIVPARAAASSTTRPTVIATTSVR